MIANFTGQEVSFINMGIALAAGLLSVLSPCILPILPILVSGSEKDHKLRPIVLILGISFTFILMGILFSIIGAPLQKQAFILELIAGLIFIILGAVFIFGINPFAKITLFNKLNTYGQGKGLISGFIMGLTMGAVWIPCVGPQLSSVLAMVATQGGLMTGIILLLIYSLGFSIPILLVSFASQTFREKTKFIKQNPQIINYVSGALIMFLGLYFLFKGIFTVSVIS